MLGMPLKGYVPPDQSAALNKGYTKLQGGRLSEPVFECALHAPALPTGSA